MRIGRSILAGLFYLFNGYVHGILMKLDMVITTNTNYGIGFGGGLVQ